MSDQNALLADITEPSELNELETIRHSCAHIMAHAISRLWPEAKFGIGPTVEDGFYYDVDLPVKLSPEDLTKIEKEMIKVVNENGEFIRTEHSIPEAIEIFKAMNQPFKVEIIETLRDHFQANSVSTYKEGAFTDLCRGPHIKRSNQIKAFKVMSLAGAYWRGNDKNPQLQRIYGTAFLSKADLHEHLHLLEEAKRRDHRKLGKELDLFAFHPEAPASPFFHPKGAVIYNRLIQYVRDMYAYYGYDEVITPQIFDTQLWKTSGHYDNYKDDMFFVAKGIDAANATKEAPKASDPNKVAPHEREFAVKPMNCPASTYIFSSNKRSYRDLPLRYADFGRLHRNELSGVTAGLTRVRTFCQDDAHVYCTLDQVESEIDKIIDMMLKTYTVFDFNVDDLEIFLSTRPEKRIGGDEVWDQAESSLKKILDKMGRPYGIDAGGGAFYGPKIDIKVKDALKRKWQLATVQLDFNLPERFDCSYVGSDNIAHRPVVIHKAVLGSLERFMGVFIEHCGGAFPFWLAPIQCRVIPITEVHNEYCAAFTKKLRALGIRFELDDRNEKMGLKTREAQMAKIPLMLVVGDREMAEDSFAVRKYGAKDSQVMKIDEILAQMAEWNDLPKKPFRLE
ncbi:MAG: threonine--tRNA ligase [Bdellovibrionales bacterium]|nr:threonine--tRNA ligase [Oligoflexia bacterium]